MIQLHGTCVSLRGVGLLLCGEAQSGKSSLAIELISRGAELVADDVVILESIDNKLLARAPSVGFGMIECTGVGVLKTPHATQMTVLCLAAILQHDMPASRVCEPEMIPYMGVMLPHYRVYNKDPYLASKLCMLMEQLLHEGSLSTVSEVGMPKQQWG